MEAELIVLEGTHSGNRFPLSSHEVRAGRSPAADIRLHDSAAAGDHCVFRPQNGGHCVVDRDTEEGTFVNGRRVSQATLAPGDRIAVGETVFLYRQAAPAEGGRALLQACSVLFLFRALSATENQGYRETIEAQLTELLHEMVPSAGIVAVLGGTAAEIAAQVPGRLRALVLEAATEGSASAGDATAVGLWVRGKLAGAIAAWFAQEPPPGSRDALGAVAALAAAALESQDGEPASPRPRGCRRNRDCGGEHPDTQAALHDCPAGAARYGCLDHRGNRLRQRTGGARSASLESALRTPIRRHQLRRADRDAAGERIVRP